MAIAKIARLRRRIVLRVIAAAVIVACAWIAVAIVVLRSHSDATATHGRESDWRWPRQLARDGARLRLRSDGEPSGVAGSSRFFARAPEYWIDVAQPSAADAAAGSRQRPKPAMNGGRPANDGGGELSTPPAPHSDCPRSELRCEGDVGCAAAAFADLEMAPASEGCASLAAAVAAEFRGSSNNASSSSGLTIVIVLRDRADSVPVQTFLSAHAFTPAYALRDVLLALPGDNGSHGNATAEVTRERWLTAAGQLLRAYGCAGDWTSGRRLVTGRTAFDAVVAAARLSRSSYLAVVADSVVFAPGWAEPLLDAAGRSARAVFVPHVDALLPNLIYSAPYGRQAFSEPQSSVWTVGWSLSYRELLAPGRVAAGSWLASAALSSDTYLVGREFLLETADSAGAVDRGGAPLSALHLGYAAWTCGSGVFLVGCSTVLKASNYFHAIGSEADAEEERDAFAAAHMGVYEQLYMAAADDTPGHIANQERQQQQRRRGRQQSGRQTVPADGCRDFRWYAEEVARLPLTRLSPADIEKVERLGSLASLFSGRCFRFDDSGGTVVAVELDSCATNSASTFFVQRAGRSDDNAVGPLLRAVDGACLACSLPACGPLLVLSLDDRTDGGGGRCMHLTGDGLLADNRGCCLMRLEVDSGGDAAATIAAENCSSISPATSRRGKQASNSAWTWTLVP